MHYDAATGDDTFFAYDAGGRVKKITVGDSLLDTTPTARDTFWYGPDGQRYLRKARWDDNGTLKTSWTLYLQGGTFEEVHPEHDSAIDYRQRVLVTGSVQHQFVKPTAGAGTSHIDYLHRDHLGNIVAGTDESGALVNSTEFDPFGRQRGVLWGRDASGTEMDDLAEAEDTFTARGYTDHEMLNRTGFVHMNGRVYDARIGRFIQADPIVGSPHNSQNYNRYAYVFNSPLSYTDPSGFDSDEHSSTARGWGWQTVYSIEGSKSNHADFNEAGIEDVWFDVLDANGDVIGLTNTYFIYKAIVGRDARGEIGFTPSIILDSLDRDTNYVDAENDSDRTLPAASLVGVSVSVNLAGVGRALPADTALIATFFDSPGAANLTGVYNGVFRLGPEGIGWTIIEDVERVANRFARIGGVAGATLEFKQIRDRLAAGDAPRVVFTKSGLNAGAGALLAAWPVGTGIGILYIAGDAAFPGAIDHGIEQFYNGLSDPQYEDLWLRALTRGPYDP